MKTGQRYYHANSELKAELVAINRETVVLDLDQGGRWWMPHDQFAKEWKECPSVSRLFRLLGISGKKG